ncbi:MAG: hypothetical protein EZS28_014592 [Streblomastix strix]|uniref:DDE-1 domain-containing protein n=1 Tax=Streblomastix strix TaxID=222440 RepID=A0A5J4W4L3_9EUKA|nr:MAG: hypothetical protein EZS28_014592 [Streblomastix strix]
MPEKRMVCQKQKQTHFFTDKASSHCTQVVRDLLQANLILLLTLPPNSTHLLQPCESASLLSIANSFRASTITTVVQNGKLIAWFFQESIGRVIKVIQADNAAMPVPLVNPKGRKRVSKFDPLNATPKK